MMEKEKVCRCALASVLQFRPKLAIALLERFGNAAEIFRLQVDELSVLLGGDISLAQAVTDPQLQVWGREEVKWAASKGVEILSVHEEAYPKLLAECPDAPLVLYYKGNADLNNKKSVAIVGTRLASGYGKENCYTVAEHLSQQDYHPLIVSGLAYGIDVAAHKAALDLGLDTVAVLPNGIDTIYPSGHREIAKRMIKQGGILTEFPRGIPARKINFIKRNRIIAGMVQAVIVIESRIKGGAMSTVEFANSYNRDIFALAGRLNDTNSYGCNYLIARNVAAIYYNEMVVPQMLGWKGYENVDVHLQPNLFSFNFENKEKILLSLKADLPTNVDGIVLATGLNFNEIAFLLVELELEGKIVSAGGRGYCLRK